MKVETFPFEPERYFQSAKAQQRLLADAQNSEDAEWLAHVVKIIERAVASALDMEH